MSIRLLAGVLTLGVVLAGTASAQVVLEPIPVEATIAPIQVGPDNGAACEDVYRNTFGGIGAVGVSGSELADDLHTTLTQLTPLCHFVFGYTLASGTTDALITFYMNDGSDSGVGPVIAGPFQATGLPGGGSFEVNADVFSGNVGPDVWMGVRLSNVNAAHIFYPDPTVGASHNVLAVNGVPAQAPIPGEVGNLYRAVQASRPTGTQASTWGNVKAIYR